MLQKKSEKPSNSLTFSSGQRYTCRKKKQLIDSYTRYTRTTTYKSSNHFPRLLVLSSLAPCIVIAHLLVHTTFAREAQFYELSNFHGKVALRAEAFDVLLGGTIDRVDQGRSGGGVGELRGAAG